MLLSEIVKITILKFFFSRGEGAVQLKPFPLVKFHKKKGPIQNFFHASRPFIMEFLFFLARNSRLGSSLEKFLRALLMLKYYKRFSNKPNPKRVIGTKIYYLKKCNIKLLPILRS